MNIIDSISWQKNPHWATLFLQDYDTFKKLEASEAMNLREYF